MRATIVGAGIAGLTAALALRSTGVDVTVVEAAAAPASPDTPGLAVLSPNASRVLRALRLFDVLAPHASRPQWQHLRSSASGYVVAWRGIGDLAQARYGAPWLYLPHGLLLQVLAATAAERGAELCFGHRFTAFDASGRALFAPRDLPPADVLIGADGTGSRVAAALGLPATTGSRPCYLWHGWLQRHRLPAAMEHTAGALTHWLGPRVQLLTAPAADNRWYWRVLSRSDAPLADQFDGWGRTVNQLLTLVEPPDAPTVVHEQVPPPSFSSGNAVLVGAAAHPLLPHGEQGPALAVEDAWVLAHLLEDFEDDVAAGLAEYHRHRRGRVQRVQRHVRMLAQQAHAPGRWQRLRHTVGIAVTSRLLPELTMQSDDWLYGYDAVRHYG